MQRRQAAKRHPTVDGEQPLPRSSCAQATDIPGPGRALQNGGTACSVPALRLMACTAICPAGAVARWSPQLSVRCSMRFPTAGTRMSASELADARARMVVLHAAHRRSGKAPISAPLPSCCGWRACASCQRTGRPCGHCVTFISDAACADCCTWVQAAFAQDSTCLAARDASVAQRQDVACRHARWVPAMASLQSCRPS